MYSTLFITILLTPFTVTKNNQIFLFLRTFIIRWVTLGPTLGMLALTMFEVFLLFWTVLRDARTVRLLSRNYLYWSNRLHLKEHWEEPLPLRVDGNQIFRILYYIIDENNHLNFSLNSINFHQ